MISIKKKEEKKEKADINENQFVTIILGPFNFYALQVTWWKLIKKTPKEQHYIKHNV